MSLASSQATLLANYKSEQMCERYHDILIATTWDLLIKAILPNFYWDYRLGLITDVIIADAPALDRTNNGIYHGDGSTLTDPAIPVYITGTSTLTINMTLNNKQTVYLCSGNLTATLNFNSKLTIQQGGTSTLTLTLNTWACPCLVQENSSNSVITCNNDSKITLMLDQDATSVITLNNDSYANIFAFGDSDVDYTLTGTATITANERDQGEIHV